MKICTLATDPNQKHGVVKFAIYRECQNIHIPMCQNLHQPFAEQNLRTWPSSPMHLYVNMPQSVEKQSGISNRNLCVID